MICLDTDVASSILRKGGGPPELARRLGTLTGATQFTTSITVGELLYGAWKRRSEGLQRDIERLIAGEIQVAAFDEPAARVYAEIRVLLEAVGQRLDDADLRIAAICLARDFTLITGNVRHFERVPGLRVANWLT
ncbi:type II toxin-antitoxin system VapC family toxin [soil metagenome]